MAGLNKLSAKQVEMIRKNKTVGKHFDGGGLFLQVTDAGGCYWRYKYRLGKEKLFAIGTLEDYTLAEARTEHLKARKIVASGDDPVAARSNDKREKEAIRSADRSFREVAQEWYGTMIGEGASSSTKDRYTRAIRNMNDGFGAKPITRVTVADLAKVLDIHEKQGKFATRERDQGAAIKIGGYCVGRGYLPVNPFREVKFAEAFTSPATVHRPRPALVEPEPFGKMMRELEASEQRVFNKMSLRILALTITRPIEMAKAKWEHVNFAAKKMVVPALVLKQRTQRKKARDERSGKDFEIPLSKQALAELRSLHEITGSGEYLFPVRATRKKRFPHMRSAGFNETLRRLNYADIHCAHGFRSSFSTMMNAERIEVAGRNALLWPEQSALIEVQLDHNDASTKAIYDRGGRWEERAELMQLWADRIDQMRAGGKPRLQLVA